MQGTSHMSSYTANYMVFLTLTGMEECHTVIILEGECQNIGEQTYDYHTFPVWSFFDEDKNHVAL